MGSKGTGWLQQALLELIEQEPQMDTFVLTARVFNVQRNDRGQKVISKAQVVSVRRALLGLQQANKIRGFGGRGPGTRRTWMLMADASLP